MTEYVLPYHEDYALDVDGRSFSPTKGLTNQVRKLYRDFIPDSIRKPFFNLREGVREEFEGPYPHIVHVPFKDISIAFEVHNERDRERVATLSQERKYIGQCLSILEPDDIVWDIGAFLGAWSLPLALKQPSCRFYCFEPEPLSRQMLETNIRLNGLNSEQISILPFAVSDKKGLSTLFTFRKQQRMPSLRVLYEKEDQLTVPAHTIDTLINESMAPQPSIIKIDVEGAEQLIVEGMSYAHRPRHLFVEFHPTFLMNNYNTTPLALWEKICSLDFVPQTVWLRSTSLLCHFSKSRQK